MITSTKSLASERARRRENRIRQLEQDRNLREARIFERVPRLGEIKAIQSDIGLDLARLVLRVPTRFGKGFAELKSWSEALSAERLACLQTYGLDPAELEVQWDCPTCKNTGWLQPEEAEDHTVRPSRKCHCLLQEEIDDLYRVSGLTGPLRTQTFAHFDLTVYPSQQRDYMSRVLDSAKTYAQRVSAGTQEESLLLMGEVGRGKTYLATAIASAAVDAKRSVVYFTFSEFLDLVRLHKFDDHEGYREGVQRLLESDLIVLDDLGAEKVTEFVGQELFNMINYRMNRRKPMVVSTNLTPGEIEDLYGARIASRLVYGFELWMLKGDDIREVLVRRRTGA
jgi:DNA replication protein DnaC